MGTKKSINFIEEADVLNQIGLNDIAGGLASTPSCSSSSCLCHVSGSSGTGLVIGGGGDS